MARKRRTSDDPVPDFVSPDEAGFTDSALGHEMTGGNKSTRYNWGSYYDYACTCGVEFTTHITLSNRASGRGLKSWRRHLEAVSTPSDEITHIGTIKKPRVTWKIYVFSRNYENANLYLSGRRSDWLDADKQDGWYSEYNWAVGVDKGSRGKVMLTIAQDKRRAVDMALRELAKGHDDGFEVEYALESTVVLPPPSSPQTMIATLLEQADAATEADLGSINAAIVGLDTLLSYLDLVKLKREALVRVRDERTLGLVGAGAAVDDL